MNMEQATVECNRTLRQSPRSDGPFQVADNNRPFDVFDRAQQIRHLAIIGFAARDSMMKVRELNSSYLSLFEVIARLADEIENEVGI